MDLHELSNEQRRQLIDAQQAFHSWRQNSKALRDLGTLRWQSSKGQRYLYEVHDGVRKSVGRETPALVQRKVRHDEERQELKRLVKGLTKRLDEMAPVNRALRLNRIPNIAAGIIRELDRENLLGSHIIVAGTNALYAYEAATGTVLGSEHVATTELTSFGILVSLCC
jgi:Nucleotidyltransferase